MAAVSSSPFSFSVVSIDDSKEDGPLIKCRIAGLSQIHLSPGSVFFQFATSELATLAHKWVELAQQEGSVDFLLEERVPRNVDDSTLVRGYALKVVSYPPASYKLMEALARAMERDSSIEPIEVRWEGIDNSALSRPVLHRR